MLSHYLQLPVFGSQQLLLTISILRFDRGIILWPQGRFDSPKQIAKPDRFDYFAISTS